MPSVYDFLSVARSHHGARYSWIGRFGPNAYDCSGHIYAALRDVGVPFATSSSTQYAYCRDRGTEIPFDQSLRTPGALLFMPTNPLLGIGAAGHIAVSLGNGLTSEARGKAWGVGSWPVAGRKWSPRAALIPGLDYGAGPTPPPTISLKKRGEMIIQPNRVGTPAGRTPAATLDPDGNQIVLGNGASIGYDQPWVFGLRHYVLDGQGGRVRASSKPVELAEWKDATGKSLGVVGRCEDWSTFNLPWS